MAANPQVRQARKTLLWLLILILGLGGILGAGVAWGGASWLPKLALDLEGGTQIILSAQQIQGKEVTAEGLSQAVGIIRNRVDATGVAEAEITTQGSNNIVVSLPGVPDEATMERIEASAELTFRPVLVAGAAVLAGDPEDGTEGDGTEGEPEDGAEGDGAEANPAPDDATAVPQDDAETEEPATGSGDAAAPANASDLAWVTDALRAEFEAFECTSASIAAAGNAPADRPLITCASIEGVPAGATVEKFILGPVELSGTSIANASGGMQVNSQGFSTGQWVVNLEFDDTGRTIFGTVTQRLYTIGQADQNDPRNRFAVVLDGAVVTSPTANVPIPNGRAEISGSFTQDSAKALAEQLRFGALPLSFTVVSNESISATLGSEQLASGIIAGIIGLVLVVIYSLFQYRVLGLVTVASLLVAAVLAYLVITILSWRQGYRLSLAGVTGLIVAIGITADSFIVYFERVRDELRDGKVLGAAVAGGWRRALRTILASDGVNFIAAAVLFFLAVGNVRGFAFTLGITTIIDLIVVAMFTHPLLVLLSQTRFFGDGHPASGLDPRMLGAVYRGRAQFREPVAAPKSKQAKVAGEAAKRRAQLERSAEGGATRLTIAERKAAEAAAGANGPTAGEGDER